MLKRVKENNMKKILIIFIALILLSTVSYSQINLARWRDSSGTIVPVVPEPVKVSQLTASGEVLGTNITKIIADTSTWNAKGTNYTVYGSGTAYTLTVTSDTVKLGTTRPTLTISTAGTYLIIARVRADYVGATFAAIDSIEFKIRRGNNTAGDITNSTAYIQVPILTTGTYTATAMDLPPIIYTTANTTDNLQLWGRVMTASGAGSVQVISAVIVAIRIL